MCRDSLLLPWVKGFFSCIALNGGRGHGREALSFELVGREGSGSAGTWSTSSDTRFRGMVVVVDEIIKKIR